MPLVSPHRFLLDGSKLREAVAYLSGVEFHIHSASLGCRCQVRRTETSSLLENTLTHTVALLCFSCWIAGFPVQAGAYALCSREKVNAELSDCGTHIGQTFCGNGWDCLNFLRDWIGLFKVSVKADRIGTGTVCKSGWVWGNCLQEQVGLVRHCKCSLSLINHITTIPIQQH